jgi:hypothetical protein
MPTLPESGIALLVRTDFADNDAWRALCRKVAEPSDEGFTANVDPVSDPAFDGAEWEAVKSSVPPNDQGSMIVLIADSVTLGSGDHPILVVDLMDYEGEHLEPFRCVPGQLAAVENNLNLANLDWDDFAGSTDENRVFRGF